MVNIATMIKWVLYYVAVEGRHPAPTHTLCLNKIFRFPPRVFYIRGGEASPQ